MDTMEFKKILEITDKELEEAKREWEVKARKEQLEQRKRLLLHWKERLEARKAEFAKYGATPSVDLDAKISEVKRDLEELEKDLAGDSNGKHEEERVPVDPKARAAVEEILDEINHGPSIAELPYGERVFRLQEWALRWKIETLLAGEGAGTDGVFKAGYAAILNLRDRVAKGTTLPGLSRDPGTLEDWNERLTVVLRRQAEAARAREIQERQEKASEEAFQELSSYLGGTVTEEDTLKHLVRKAASFYNLRFEIASLVNRYRDLLGREFDFLWDEKEDEEEESSSKKLSSREIAGRMLRRLKSKSMVGASHAPAEKVTQGFASHDYGRAQEALDALVKAGIVRRRRTGIGLRVSIEPQMMAAVDAVLEGRPTGIALFDDWARKE